MIETETFPVEKIVGHFAFIGGKKIPFISKHATCRNYVRWKNYIIKFGEQGRSEFLTWERVNPADAKYFVPIEGHGYTLSYFGKNDNMPETIFWVVQEWRNFKKTTKHPEIIRPFYEELVKVLRKYKVNDIEFFKHSVGYWELHNWAMMKDLPVCYDYGV